MKWEKKQTGDQWLRKCTRAKRVHNLPNHSYPNRPRRIPDREAEIRVIGALVLTLLHMVDNLCHTWQHVIRKGL